MDDMKELNLEAYEYLEAIEPSSWWILDARELPVMSMFQKIKNQLSTRFYSKNKESEEWCGTICPKIRKILDKNAEMANNSQTLPCGKGIFTVLGLIGEYKVDINKYTCSCRAWQLTGIPCRHGIFTCLRGERIKPEDVVSPCYSIAAFKKVYGEVIMPCRDAREWEKTNAAPVLPPLYEKHVGRPSNKRKKNPVETDEGKLSRHGAVTHCSICRSVDHNKRTCHEKGRLGQQTNPGQGERDDTRQGEQPEAGQGHDEVVQGQNSITRHIAKKTKIPVKRRIISTDQTTSSASFVGSTLIQVCEQNMSVLDILMQSSQPSQESQAPRPLPDNQFFASQIEDLPMIKHTTTIIHVAPKKNRRKETIREKEKVLPRKQK